MGTRPATAKTLPPHAFIGGWPVAPDGRVQVACHADRRNAGRRRLGDMVGGFGLRLRPNDECEAERPAADESAYHAPPQSDDIGS